MHSSTLKSHARRRSYSEVISLVEEATVAARLGNLPQAMRLLDSAYGFDRKAA